MPILYIHGVNVRSRDGFLAIEGYLRRYLAPVISAEPEQVLIDDVFWGPLGVEFAWGGRSRPRSAILAQGGAGGELDALEGAMTAAVFSQTLRHLPVPSAAPQVGGGLIASGSQPTSASAAPVYLHDLPAAQIGDLLATAIAEQVPDSKPIEQTRLILAADTVAHAPGLHAALVAAGSPQAELGVLLNRVRQQANAGSGLLGQGWADWFDPLRDRLDEGLSRALSLPSYAISTVLAELRRPLNELFSMFIGDVFAYLSTRGDSAAPGAIAQLLLDKLKLARAHQQTHDGEPIILVSHSMGGQLVYDAISHFLPNTPELANIKIDFWCATASQVGFFEEAKLFLASHAEYKTGSPVPFPQPNLGVWWNVWDHNDFLSFTAKDIFAEIDDESFDNGMSLLGAHGGYLKRPSFYRRFAAKLEIAKANQWSR